MNTGHSVSMFRNSAELGGRDRFSCSKDSWDLLLEVGKAFGWKAQGASYVPTDIAIVPDELARHDYQPGDVQDSKSVAASDAFEWAKALNEARNSPHLAAMIGDRPLNVVLHPMAAAQEQRNADAPFITIMDEFTAYAFGGGFEFFRSE